MTTKTFSEEQGAMSKSEKLAWLHFWLLMIAGVCMGWLWWSSWPDSTALQRNADLFEPWQPWLIIAGLVGVWFIKLRGAKEPLADERDHAINGEARANGFAALALMVVVLCAAVRTEGLLQDNLTPEWLTLTLMSMLVLAFLVDASYRIVRYRIG